MTDLASEMTALAARLGPPPGARARVVQFVSPDAGADAGPIARAFALEVARSAARGVWLIELDLLKSAQHRFFQDRQDRYGELGPAARATPSQALPFTVSPKAPGAPAADEDYYYAQAVGGRRLWVTRFRREALQAGQSVKILADGGYYEALRPHADYVVVEAPPDARSPAARAVAAHMDDNVIVVSGRNAEPAAALSLKEELRAAGGRCAGLVLTDAPREPPSFISRLLD